MNKNGMLRCMRKIKMYDWLLKENVINILRVVLSVQLFSNFAEPYDLPQIKLAILHSASHPDTAMVESFWTEIINKGLDNRHLVHSIFFHSRLK